MSVSLKVKVKEVARETRFEGRPSAAPAWSRDGIYLTVEVLMASSPKIQNKIHVNVRKRNFP